VTVHALADDAGTALPASLVAVVERPVDPSPFDGPVPGAAGVGPPTDPDRDGRYEDVDGDGTFALVDVISLAFVDADALGTAQRAALDFDGDGDLGFGDVVDLLFRLP
jgi:PKD repeat protein